MNNEVWKDLPDNLKLTNYHVSTLGRIKNKTNNKILKLTPHRTGYIKKNLVDVNGQRKPYQMHRLIAYAFHKNESNKPEVDHINRDTTDNRYDNLRWVTKKENASNKTHSRKGRPRAIVQMSMQSEYIRSWNSINEAANECNLHKNGIRHACCGKTLRCGEWKWKYVEDIEDVNDKEEWKEMEINGYKYKISNMGRVEYTTGKRTYGYKCKAGYLYVTLDKPRRVHRLVMLAFKPIRYSEYLVVNHKDENGSNNKLNNLEWCINQYNTEYSCAMPVVQYSMNDILIRIYKSISEATRCTNIESSSIMSVCKNMKGYCHAGKFKWKYLSNTDIEYLLKRYPNEGIEKLQNELSGVKISQEKRLLLSEGDRIVTMYDNNEEASQHLNIDSNNINDYIVNATLINSLYKLEYADEFNERIDKDMIDEKWFDIDGDRKISNYGRVRCLNKKVTFGEKCQNGTRRIKYNNKYVMMHDLIMKLFGENNYVIGGEYNVIHIDGDKDNNSILNLKLYRKKRKVSQYTIDGIFVKTYKSILEAAKDNNIQGTKISAACQGKKKQYMNWIWKYEN